MNVPVGQTEDRPRDEWTDPGRIEGVVIIVGGSVCGLATAIALAKQGWYVTVLEKRQDPRSYRPYPLR